MTKALTFSMKTQKELEDAIKKVEEVYEHVLTGPMSMIHINAPRALMQSEAETKLKTLHWCLGTKYVSKLKGVE